MLSLHMLLEASCSFVNLLTVTTFQVIIGKIRHIFVSFFNF